MNKKYKITTKLAYIAGFVDGEGCIRIKKSNQCGNSYYVTFQVTNTSKKPLELIKSIFGGKVYFQERGKNRTVWQYYSTCNEAIDALRMLSGFLIEKKKQAELAIKFHDTQQYCTPKQKKNMHDRISKMKKFNIYENPNLLDTNPKA